MPNEAQLGVAPEQRCRGVLALARQRRGVPSAAVDELVLSVAQDNASARIVGDMMGAAEDGPLIKLKERKWA